MSLIRKHFEDRRSWLEGRQELGLGGSDAAAVCGLSPWMSPVELWKIKTGQKKAKDISSDEVVERGVRMEPALRTLYAAMNPTVQVEYYPFDILAIKTGQTMKKADYEKWSDGKIPDNYYCQTLFQLLATGWEFVDLFAALEDIRGDWSIRTRHIERASCEDDLAWLLEKAEIFWGYVQRRQMPPMVLRL